MRLRKPLTLLMLAVLTTGFWGVSVRAESLVKPLQTATLPGSPRQEYYMEAGEAAPIVQGIGGAGEYQTIQSKPLPPVSTFPLEKRNETFLTNFILGYNRKLSWEEANMLADAILAYSRSHDVDFRLITGVLAVESSFRSDAISSSGAIGLGQLKPATAQWLGVANPFDPIDNIGGATRYLKFLLNRYNNDLDSALAAYFQGQGTIDRNGITAACKPYLVKINNVLSKF